jgi:iron complex outermembrane recepter protein
MVLLYHHFTILINFLILNEVKMKKYAFLIGVLTFFGFSGTAQNKISGTISDAQTKEKLVGASISISDLKTGATTDLDGFFEIKNIKNGKYLFEISFLGYKSVIENISIDNDITLDFALLEAHTEIKEVVVTGVSRASELKRIPFIVKTLDKNLFNQNSATNLIDGLKDVPGVNQITTGAAISKPIIRGLGYNRVVSLFNGIRQEGQQWGDEHGIEIDEFEVDRIEIVKGPGSLMYGSDAIAGVLNFISAKQLPVEVVKTQFISNYQSNNQLIANSLSNAGNKNGIQWLGRLSNKMAGNYQNKYDGKVYNSGFKEFDGSLFLGINRNWGHSHLQFNSYNTSVNLVEGDRDSLGRFIFANENGEEKTASISDLKGYKIGFPHQKINHIRLASNNLYIVKNGTLNLDLGFQNNKRREFGDVQNPNDIALFFDLNTFNYNFRYNIESINGWETSLGIGGMAQSNKNKGLEFLIPEYNSFDIGSFIFTQKTFAQKLTLAGGLRFDNRTLNAQKLVLDSLDAPTTAENASTFVKFNSFRNNYNGTSGSLGLSYQINEKSTLKGNLSRGFRAPNISELASNGRHEGTLRYEIGSKDLKSEISHQLDLAYFYKNDHLSFELTPFVNGISNFIYTSKLTNTNGQDSIIDMEDPAPVFEFRQGKTTLFGGEIYLDFHPHPLDWLHIENSFSYVQATQSKQSDSTKYLPNIPAPKYRAELKADFKKIGNSISNAYFKIGVDYFFAQNNIYSAYGTETATPSYALLGAGIGGNIKAYGKKDFFSLFISANNLTDVAYQSHLSRLKYAPQNPLSGRNGVFNMGRNVSLKLILNL